MILFIIVGTVLLAIAFAGLIFVMRENDTELTWLISATALIFVSITAAVFVWTSYRAIAATTRAEVLSIHLEQNFTPKQVFFAGSDIEKLYYGDLRRFNVQIDTDDLERLIEE